MSKHNDFIVSAKRILVEEITTPTVLSYIAASSEMLEALNPRTVKEAHTLSVLKQNLAEIKKRSRKMIEENSSLREQVRVLEEGQEYERDFDDDGE